MTVRLRAGGATDVGQLRTINQDSMLVRDDLVVVADGMGGHRGGEVASAMAVDRFESYPEGATTTSQLIARVQDANDAVYERSGGDPALTGMGTTLVATAVVAEAGEERIAIVNVGDSRAYRLAGGVLEQISDDHSLVGEMVRDGRISADDARGHPQKNIVTRAVGIEPTVDVDEFQILPHAGDRYLLCSDGLTDEVDEAGIAEVLTTVEAPDAAAEELVRRANEAGGRDNITVVIVDVVDDGGLSADASAAVPDAARFSHHADTDTDMLLAVPDHRAHVADRDASAGGDHDAGAVAPDTDGDARQPRQRAITVRSVAFVLVVAALIGAGLWLANDYARNTYHLDVDDEEVVVVRGRPGGFLWFDTEIVDRTGIDADDVPAEFADAVSDHRTFSSRDSAATFIDNVEDRIDELTTTTTTTTTTSTSTSTTTTTVTSSGGG